MEQHISLSSIFFLKQANTDEVVQIGEGEATVYINKLATQVLGRTCCYVGREEGRRLGNKLLDNACQLAKAIPAFILRMRQKWAVLGRNGQSALVASYMDIAEYIGLTRYLGRLN